MQEENELVQNTPLVVMESDNSEINTQFEGILDTLGSFRQQITILQNQIRGLEKLVKKEMKGLKKEAVKSKNRGNRKPSGFARPSKISDALCNFMNRNLGTEIARTEVTQYLIQYIKDNGLQNPNNRKNIEPDEKLSQLLGVDSSDNVTYFNLQRYMNKHFLKESS